MCSHPSPTKADIKALFLRLEETHCKDLQEVHMEEHQVVERVSTGETATCALEACIPQLEMAQASQATHVSTLQPHLEDWSCCNNLRP